MQYYMHAGTHSMVLTLNILFTMVTTKSLALVTMSLSGASSISKRSSIFSLKQNGGVSSWVAQLVTWNAQHAGMHMHEDTTTRGKTREDEKRDERGGRRGTEGGRKGGCVMLSLLVGMVYSTRKSQLLVWIVVRLLYVIPAPSRLPFCPVASSR